MASCTRCGTTNGDGSTYCGRCGTSLNPGTVPAGPLVTGNVVTGAGMTPVGSPNVPPPMDARGVVAAGAIIDQKYTIERVIGEGGMGVVYLARDIHTGLEVVIKAVRSELAHRPDVRQRTLAEGRALGRIDHPNVVQLKALVVDGTGIWLVMQFIDGESLDKTIARYAERQQFMPVDEVLAVFRQIVAGVAAAHREGVIHRDLKPANVLVRTKDRAVKVTDFGIAKMADENREQTRGIIGSLWYMSPEQVTGRRDLDLRVDVYALGIVLYQMLVGRVPFDADSDYDIMKLQAEAIMPRVSAVRPGLPLAFDELIQRATAKDREQRYASCDDLLAAVDRVVALANSRPARTVGDPSPDAGPPGATVPAAPVPWVAPTTGPGYGAATGPGYNSVSAPGYPPATGPGYAPTTGPGYAPTTGPGYAPTTGPGYNPVTGPGYNPVAGRAHDATTGQGAVLAVTPPRATGLWVALAVGGGLFFGLVVLVVAAGAGMFGSHRDPTVTGVASAAPLGTTTRPPALDKTASAPPPSVSPLDALSGPWVANGHDLDAVVVGDQLEFRVRVPAQFAPQNYETGEARFVLRATSEPNVFATEDRIRPIPPLGKTYDPRSRGTCQEVWTTAGKEPLRATFDGTQLNVEFAKIEPTVQSFVIEGSRVTSCRSLSSLRAARVVTTLRRP